MADNWEAYGADMAEVGEAEDRVVVVRGTAEAELGEERAVGEAELAEVGTLEPETVARSAAATEPFLNMNSYNDTEWCRLIHISWLA